MSFQSLHFPRQSYPSLQIGDMAYRIQTSDTNDASGFTIGLTNGIILGEVFNIQDGTITQNGVTTLTTLVTINTSPVAGNTTTNAFIFFVKNEQVEVGNVVGYFGNALFENNSNQPAELYAASCEFSESSK